MIPFYCASVVLLCFIQRLSMVWRVRFAFDSWGHFYFLTAVKRQKTGPFAPIWINVAEGGPFHYPLLTHWLLSLLPEATLQKRIKAINPFFEALWLGFCMVLSFWAEVDAVVVLGAGLLYIFTPMMFSKVAIGSTSHFTTRLYSELSTGLLLLLAFLPLPASDVVLCILMAFLVAYIVLSSKFGLQVVLLVVLPAALFTPKPVLVAALIFGFIGAVAASRGSVLNVWREQGRHLLWYLGEVRKGTVPASDRNSLALFREALALSNTKEKLIQFGFVLAGRNSFTGLAIKFPVVIIVALLSWGGLEGAVAANGFTVIISVAVFVFILINSTVLIFLGEGERYLNHFAFLIILVFAEWALTGGETIWYWLAVSWGIAYWLCELVLLGLLGLNQAREDQDGTFTTLTRIAPEGSVVLCYPYHVLPPWRLLASSTLRPIFPIVGTGHGASRLKKMERYPFMNLSYLEELRRDFGLAFVIVKDSKLDHESKQQLTLAGWNAISDTKADGITIFKYSQRTDEQE